MKYPILKTFILLWISHFFVDFFLGIWPLYKTLAGIDLARAGLIMGVTGFIGEILQIVFGYFADRGLRKTIIIIGLLLAPAITLGPLGKGAEWLFFLMLLTMIGSGSFHPSAVGTLSALSANKKRAILFFTTGGALGLGLSQFLFVKALSFTGGKSYFLFLPALILIPFLLVHPFSTSQREKTPFKEFFTPLRANRRSLALLYFSQVTSYGVLLSFIFLLPDILKEKGASNWLFMGGGHMSFIFGAFLGMLILGFFSHKMELKKTLLTAAFTAFLLLFVFLLFPLFLTPISIALLGLLGGSLFLMNPMIIAWGNHIVPESPSTVSGLLMGFAWCLSNLFPAAVGMIKIGSPTLSMGILSLALAASFLLLAAIPHPRPEVAVN